MQEKVLLAFAISCLISVSVDLASKGRLGQTEQTDFSVEQELVPVEKPLRLRQPALEVLAKEGGRCPPA